jgi:acetolactate synthase regulatory subunit
VIAREGDNGGRPSRKGARPEKAQAGPEVVLVLSDRLDALERLLGTVRRRGMTLGVFSLTRRNDELVLTLRADSGAALPDRWIAELGALVDVRQVKVTPRG